MGANTGAVGKATVAHGPSWVGFAVLLALVLVTAGIAVQLSDTGEGTGNGAAVVETVPISVAAVEHRGDFRGGAVKVAPAFVPAHGPSEFHPGTVKVGVEVDAYRATRLVPDGRRN